MGTHLLQRYLEKTLGLSRLNRDFFEVESRIEPEPLPEPLRCYLLHREVLDKPSLAEMAERLRQAVESEFTKHRMAGLVEVNWWDLGENKIWPDGRYLLSFEFGGGSEPQDGPIIRLPRLEELHSNPMTKRDAWKLIQTSISRCVSESSDQT